jgi:hypothetical protein
MKKLILIAALASVPFLASAQKSTTFRISSQKPLSQIRFDTDLSPDEVASYVKRAKKLNAFNEVLFSMVSNKQISLFQYVKIYKIANGKLPDIRLEYGLKYGPMPYPTTDKFLPPAIHHDEEVTKPEPPLEDLK